MNTLLLAASLLSIFVGIVHSALGERLIFQSLREGSVIPSRGCPPLRERHIRILWASWHIASLFGWGMAAILFQLAQNDTTHSSLMVNAIASAMFAAGLLVLIATQAKHPGWIGLCGVGILCWLA